MNNLVMEKAGEEQAQQVDGDRADSGFAGEIFSIQVIDPAHSRVRREQLVGKLRDRNVHWAKYSTRQVKAEREKSKS